MQALRSLIFRPAAVSHARALLTGSYTRPLSLYSLNCRSFVSAATPICSTTPKKPSSSILNLINSRPQKLSNNPTVLSTARYVSNRGPPPPPQFRFKDLANTILSFIPLPIKVAIGIFSLAFFVILAVFPSVMLYLPLLLLPYLAYRRRQNVLRDRAFRRAWDDLAGETAADTTSSRVLTYTSEQLVDMVNDRVRVAIREDGDFIMNQLGLSHPELLELGPCESIDREVQDMDAQVSVTSILRFGLLRRTERVAEVEAAIKSSMFEKVWTEVPSETTTMKITITTEFGKAWELYGMTHEKQERSRIIDIKPSNVRDE
ncbi:uncharacterized protein V2V93DRAFT_371851 [Kockiozyma suomiensis]|uniref:uncharacterized protein n=1 Tax=Kockiozyma suomiensis TaxID=1337062 RepID=UPI003342F291